MGKLEKVVREHSKMHRESRQCIQKLEKHIEELDDSNWRLKADVANAENQSSVYRRALEKIYMGYADDQSPLERDQMQKIAKEALRRE